MKKLSDKEIARQLRYLDQLKDEDIDTSDIPELTPEQLRGGIRGLFYRPVKQPVTMRLDSDIVAWLKHSGPGYQTKANALLRKEMMRALKKRPSKQSAAKKSRSRRTG